MSNSRPPGAQRKRSVRLELEPDDWILLVKIADTVRLTRSEVIRQALRAYGPGAIREAKKQQRSLQEIREDEQASA